MNVLEPRFESQAKLIATIKLLHAWPTKLLMRSMSSSSKRKEKTDISEEQVIKKTKVVKTPKSNAAPSKFTRSAEGGQLIKEVLEMLRVIDCKMFPDRPLVLPNGKLRPKGDSKDCFFV